MNTADKEMATTQVRARKPAQPSVSRLHAVTQMRRAEAIPRRGSAK